MEAGRDADYHDAAKVVTPTARARHGRGRPAIHSLHLGLDRQAEGRPAHLRRLSVFAAMTHQIRLRLSRRRYLLVHRRCRLGDRHSYIVYGPLANGATTLMFEGVPNYPSVALLGDRRQVQGQHLLHRADRDPRFDARRRCAGEEDLARSLRLLGSVGEPINPEAWLWYYRVIGDDRCPIVDTWWQTETGGIVITPLPGATDLKPGSATLPFFGIKPADRRCRRRSARRRGHRQSVHRRLLARPDAHRLWRSSAFHRHLLHDLSRQIFHRRRLPPRRGRLLLDHRPRR